MIKTLPISEARQNLPSLVDRAKRVMDQYIITVSGKPAAILMSNDEYESMQETMEILADPGLMKAIRQGEAELAQGKGQDWEEVKKELGWD